MIYYKSIVVQPCLSVADVTNQCRALCCFRFIAAAAEALALAQKRQ